MLSNAHVRGADWQRTNIDMANEQLARLFPQTWEELLALREQGVLSADLRYQRLLGQVMDDLEWWDLRIDPRWHPQTTPPTTSCSTPTSPCAGPSLNGHWVAPWPASTDRLA